MKEGEIIMARIKLAEDGSPIDWLVKNVRKLTEKEINLYLKYVFGK